MTTLLACTLTGTLCLSAGWCWGHATARIRHVPIPVGCHHADHAAIAQAAEAAEAAFIARIRREFDALTDSLNLPDPADDHPDDPRNSTP